MRTIVSLLILLAGGPTLHVEDFEDRGVEDKSKIDVCTTEDFEFLPVGFSKKSAFAYLHHTHGKRGSEWKLVIVDLRTNKPLETVRLKHESPEGCALDKLLKPKTPAKLKAALDKHGIVAVKAGQSIAIPYGESSGPFGIRVFEFDGLDHVMKLNENHESNVTTEADLKLISPTRGEKEVARIVRDTCCHVANVYGSPFEARVAIVVLASYEGDPAPCEVNVFGAHLETGFKSKAD